MKKRILSLLLVLSIVLTTFITPVTAFAADSGNLNNEQPTKQEIIDKWAEVTYATEIFETSPSITSPYAAGELSESFLESGITYLNYVRFVANLPPVQLSDSLNESAQYGAVLLAAIDELTHYPTQPEDMSDSFYEQGYSATTSSNISARYGYSSVSALQSAVSGCMDDNGSNNLSAVGHRRWLLNPTLLNVGFGYAKAASGWDYIVTKVFDQSGPAVNYDFVAWPSSGNFPTNLFGAQTPWSITLNPSKYRTPDIDNIKITLTRESDGRTWTFNSTTGSPVSGATPYMTVDTNGYGVRNCIIFNPGSSITSYDGIYTVDVSGIYTSNGSETTLHYEVDFFDVNECVTHDYTETVTAPTCTAEGYTTYTCSVCGDTYTANETDMIPHSYTTAVTAPTCTEGGYTTHTCSVCGSSYVDSETEATGHDHTLVVTEPTCTESGYTTYTCTICGHSYQGDFVPATGNHNYNAVTVAPTCTEGGFTTFTCTVCDHSYVDAETPTIPHDYEEVVTAPTCTESGFTTFTCKDCGHSYVGNETPTIPHDYEEVVTAPTCTDQGYTTHTCTVCGDSYIDTYIEASGYNHNYTSVVTPPTCGEQGYTTCTCTICGHSYQGDFVPATGEHNYSEAVTAPTCTEGGYTTYTCDLCGGSYRGDETDPIPHNYEITVIDPTETEGGYTLHTCKVCGESYQDSFTDPVPGPTTKLMGDVDDNGTVNNADLVLMARYIVELIDTMPRIDNGNLVEDSDITNADLVALARYIIS